MSFPGQNIDGLAGIAELHRSKPNPMKKFAKIAVLFLFLAYAGNLSAQEKKAMIQVPVKKGDAWWSGVINHGQMMPLKSGYEADLSSNYGNQVQPLLLSAGGEIIWSEDPFAIKVTDDTLTVASPNSSLMYIQAGHTLKDGYLYASRHFFPPSGHMPADLLFTAPQYNTWIELMYDQNQADIMDYARQIIANGFPPGVLMIDDNWQEDYGKWNFHPGRFPDPGAMMDSLHNMGFRVMLWICPMVSPDCDVYRSLRDKKMLLEDSRGEAAIVRWWNGASGLLDLSNPETASWFRSQLNRLQNQYHVDGFKFDAGDFEHYENTYSSGEPANPQEQCRYYAEIGLNYPLNEYRAMWKMGGQPLVNRLRDKAHNWEDLHKLIPDMLIEGLAGYSFTCPDMIGGGEFTSFLPGSTIDQDLIVRSAQCHALMPMMQFSVAPWRILDPVHFAAVKKAVETREKFTPRILELAESSAVTGEPVVRSMEYVFPHQGYENITDQFMLGDRILVAPVVEKGASVRSVMLPEGKWTAPDGKVIRGGREVTVPVTLESLPYFMRKDGGRRSLRWFHVV